MYSLKVEEIPLHVPSARIVLPTRFFASGEARWQAVMRDVMALQQMQRAVLVGTRSIADSQVLSDLLTAEGILHQVLNGTQSESEARIVAMAGQPGAVTIATNLAGRGTDIGLDPHVREQGGLHVIVAECQTSGRMDRQLIGRCARQGDPGSAQVFVSADDALLQWHGLWLADAIRRDAGEDGEATSNFNRQLKRVQLSAERKQLAGRMALLQRDMARDRMFRNAR